MGLLKDGIPLEWKDAKDLANFVRYHGAMQFLYLYHKNKDRKDISFKWGDEVEYYIVHFDEKNRRAVLSLRAAEVIEDAEELINAEGDNLSDTHQPHEPSSSWKPEFANFMIEGTPGVPYSNRIIHYWAVEENMIYRRQMVEKVLHPNEKLLTMGTFPTMGCGFFTEPPYYINPTKSDTAKSLFVPDEAISPHLRFSTLARNIRTRRGRKVCITLPVYMDKETKPEMIEKLNEGNHEAFEEGLTVDRNEELHRPSCFNTTSETSLSNACVMDAMAFGMGSCCLQITFQARNIEEARHLYDMMIPIAPIMLALSAGTPIFRGILVDTDVRWPVIEGAVDDRTDEEKKTIPKSRYSTSSMYIDGTGKFFDLNYNDTEVPINKKVQDLLLEGGVDELLAKHMGHLFIRDPLVIYPEGLESDDKNSSDHFENIQSTNWNPVRFKPPPADGSIGWRVEFRTMELGLTDFENAAHAVFVALLSRAILHWNCNFYIPMSQVEINAKTAFERDAIHRKKFYFNGGLKLDESGNTICVCSKSCEGEGSMYLTLDEAFNGTEGFCGLVPLCRALLDEEEKKYRISPHERPLLDEYLNFISDRASGRLMNTASWIRKFVTEHPLYHHDSVVSGEIAFDLLKVCEGLSSGSLGMPELFGEHSEASKKGMDELHNHLMTFADDETSTMSEMGHFGRQRLFSEDERRLNVLRCACRVACELKK